MKEQLAEQSIIRFFWLLILSLVIVFLDLATLLDPLKTFSFKISSPLSTGVYQIGVSFSEIIGKIYSIKTLQLENEQLSREVNLLKAGKARIYILEAENEALRKQLGSSLKEDLRILMANVVSRDLSNLTTGMLIDKGLQDKVQKDMPIIFEDCLVGYVVNVDSRVSEIVLVTSAQSKIPVQIHSSEKVVDGILKGEFNSKLKVEQIFQEDKIAKGDLVVTSGKGGQFPKGLLIGEIEEVVESDTDVFKSAGVKQSVDLRKLKTVFVILSWSR